MKKGILTVVGLIALILAMSGCSGSKTAEKPTAAPTAGATESTGVNDSEIEELTANAIDAVITFTGGETIELELYPDIAPKTVANFINYVNQGFYDGTIIHRAIDGFVIQGGGYDAQLNRKTVSETVEGEFLENGIENPLHHDRGVISMARIPSEPNSASTQFFIVVEDNRQSLDGQYAAFGKVKAGMDIVDEIAASEKAKDAPAELKDMPEKAYEIESISILNADAPSEAEGESE